MSGADRDGELWREVCQAEQERFEAVNRFLELARDPNAVLGEALTGDVWDRISALRLLLETRDKDRIIGAFPILLELATGMHGLLDLVREVIRRTPRDWLDNHLRSHVIMQLETEDDSGYRRLAELLSGLEYNELLDELVEIALASSDPDIREVGADFANRKRPLRIFN
jgi:hypothetical protein